jgi:hypothetical protein
MQIASPHTLEQWLSRWPWSKKNDLLYVTRTSLLSRFRI